MSTTRFGPGRGPYHAGAAERPWMSPEEAGKEEAEGKAAAAAAESRPVLRLSMPGLASTCLLSEEERAWRRVMLDSPKRSLLLALMMNFAVIGCEYLSSKLKNGERSECVFVREVSECVEDSFKGSPSNRNAFVTQMICPQFDLKPGRPYWKTKCMFAGYLLGTKEK